MTIIYFVRHAQPNYLNQDDALRELTEKGMEDRKLITEFLRDKEIDVVLSSPYKRSVDTVKDFADRFGFEIETVWDFRERKVDSVWIRDFDDFCRQQWSDFTYRRLDGETLGEVQHRNVKALKLVLEKYRDKNIVIGSHGTALSTIINYYNPTFAYDEFLKIKSRMPWIVTFTFDGEQLKQIETSDV